MQSVAGALASAPAPGRKGPDSPGIENWALLTRVLQRGAGARARKEESARAAERQRVLREAENESRRRIEIERVRGERLIAEARAWRQADDLRSYVAALREGAADREPDEAARIVAWCEWARDWIERTDPVLNPKLIKGLLPADLELPRAHSRW